ncbi:MAG TPA: hypothetical protein VHG71_05100 [Verrucomicrobiae bacterium]|nr:hypothetical protein [Verrucomicrobiae bacterium]
MKLSLFLAIFIFFDAKILAEANETLVADYMPFLNGQPWSQIPVVTYVESASNIWIHPSFPKKFPTIQEIHEEDSDFTTVVIQFPDGSTFKTYNKFILGPYLSAVYSGDFNNDGIPDFMMVKPVGGNGLAGEEYIGIFAFSENKDYHFTRINTWELGPQNLVLDPKTKNFRLIHTAFRQGLSVDGQYHSFWVHRVFQWNGVAFQMDKDFSPIWIQYLNRPNHEPTKLLTAELEQKIWSDDLESTIEW